MVFFEVLASNQITPSSEPVCDVALIDLRKKDIVTLVGALNFMLKHEVNEEDAVSRFLEKYVAMVELSDEYPVFEDSLQEQSRRIIGEKHVWAKLRLFVAAALSIGEFAALS
jgi:hypothetical protein